MNCAIIPAGGSGSRYSKKDPKLNVKIHHKTVFEHAIHPFLNLSEIHHIFVPCPKEKETYFKNITENYKEKVSVIIGGKTRAESVFNGFKHIPESCKHVLIHDAARPNLSETLILRILKELTTHPVVIPGIKLTDTIKKVSNLQIVETIDRNQLMAVQTPQGFDYKRLKEAYKTVADFKYVTDEAALLEQNNVFGKIVTGETENIKVTSPVDIPILSALMV